MHERVKITRRQLKEDPFTAFIFNSKRQLEENWQYFAIGAVVIILAVVGIFYYFNSAKETSELAATQLSQANMQYRQGNSQVAILTLTDILTKYGSTPFAEQATFMLAKINLETRNYAESKLYFDMYLEKYKKDPLNRAAALSGLGITLENQGQYAEASEQFEKAIAEFPESALIVELHLGAMRNELMSGQSEKAKVHLDAINEKAPNTDIAANAARLFYEKSKSSS